MEEKQLQTSHRPASAPGYPGTGQDMDNTTGLKVSLISSSQARLASTLVKFQPER